MDDWNGFDTRDLTLSFHFFIIDRNYLFMAARFMNPKRNAMLALIKMVQLSMSATTKAGLQKYITNDGP